MSEGNQDSSLLNKKATRRQFIKGAVIAGAVVVGGASALKAVTLEHQTKGISRPETSMSNTGTIERSVPEKNHKEDLVSSIVNESSLFRSFTVEDKKVAVLKVREQIDHYTGFPMSLRVEDRIKNTVQWSSVVDRCFNETVKDIEDLGYMPDPVIKEFLLPLIFVESGGDKDAVSNEKSRDEEIKARGLCQILPKTGRAIAKSLGIPFTLSKLMDPETNIKFAMVYLSKLLHDFVDPSIAFWTYHLGEQNMPVAIGHHIQSTPGISPADHKETDNKLNQISKPPGSAFLVKKYGLNFANLVTSSAFVGKLKERGAYGDDTQYYFPRIAAANILLGKNKIKI